MTNNSPGRVMILGASINPVRYSHLAALRLQEAGYPLLLLGAHPGQIGQEMIITNKPETVEIDTITLYLNPLRQKEYYDYILHLRPRRIIFNPGSENPELEALAKKNGIETENACTLVLLRTGQF